jgi:hypothetical protein
MSIVNSGSMMVGSCVPLSLSPLCFVSYPSAENSPFLYQANFGGGAWALMGAPHKVIFVFYYAKLRRYSIITGNTDREVLSQIGDKSKYIIKSKSQQNQNQKNQSLEFTVFSFQCTYGIFLKLALRILLFLVKILSSAEK